MIIYQESLQDIVPEKLEGFFAGWANPPSNEKLYEILKNSSYMVLAVDEGTGKTAGFITAISDKILSAYIPLLEVLPEYRGKGIGKELITRMLHLLDNYYMIDLTCDENMQEFYEKLGLSRSTGMVKRNYNRQNGV